MKKILTALLIFSLLIGLLPPNVGYAATYTVTESQYPGFSTLTDSQKALIEQQKIINPSNLKNSVCMYIAIKPLESQGVVVYNYSPAYLKAKGFGKDGPFEGMWIGGKWVPGNGEFQYLGYDYNGKAVTNDLYTNGKYVGFRNPYELPNFNYQKIERALASWQGMDTITEKHMMESRIESEDETKNTNPGNYSLKQILDKSVSNKGNIDEYKSRLLMQSKATIAAEGSVKTQYKGWNTQTGAPVKSYNTFTVPRLIKEIDPPVSIAVYDDAACTQPITNKDIKPTENSVTVYVKVTTDASLKKVNLGGQESKYLDHVVNSFQRQTNTLSNFANTSMSSTFPLVLNRKDFKQTYIAVPIEGSGKVVSKFDLIETQEEKKAKTVLNVKVLDPTNLDADFKIFYGAEDKTDKGIVYEKSTLDKDFTFTLKDQSYVPPDNAIVNWNWFVKNHQTGDWDYKAFTKDATFTLTQAEQAKYLKDEKLTVQEHIIDKFNKRYTKDHYVSISKTPIIEQIMLPEAHVYPPSMVRAGQLTTISGEGASGNGAIISYDFNMAADFKQTRSISNKEKEGTFLRFDASVNDDYSETTGLTVTDVAGKTDRDEADTLVKHPIVPSFRTNGVYKVNRTIELDSTASTGTTYYPIDKVTWTIRPMDGQLLSVIKPHDASQTLSDRITVVGAKPKVDFKQLGRYEVWMDVHSTCTLPGETHRTASKQVYGIITIAPDEPPVAKLSVPSKTIREFDQAQSAVIKVWDLSYSPDGDAIGKRKFYVRVDSDNDKKTDDETWQLIYEGTESQYEFSSPNVGYYEFKVEVEESNDSSASPFWNPATDTLRADSDSQALVERQTEIINIAPITTILADRKKLDLVLVTDYEGLDYAAMKTELDLLTKDLFEKGVDIRVQVFTSKVPNGTVKAAKYNYTRYLRYQFTYDGMINNQPRTNYTEWRSMPWETRAALETDYMPKYGPIEATYTTGYYNLDNPSMGIVNNGLELTVNSPTDPYQKNGKVKIAQTVAVPGSAEYYNNIRNIQFSVDSTFTKGSVSSYQDQALYCMDLDKLKSTISFREGADRQMVFIMKTGDSLTTLNQTFADYISKNKVTVNAISGFDMTSQLGGIAVQDAEWYRKSGAELGPGMEQIRNELNQYEWVVNYDDDTLKGIVAKLESGKAIAMLHPSNTAMDGTFQYYPVPEFPVVKDGYVFTTNNALNDTQRIQISDLKTDYYANEKYRLESAQKGDLTWQTPNWETASEENSKPGYTIYHRERGDDGWEVYYTLGERTLAKHMAGIKIGSTFYFVKNNNLYSIAVANMESPWTSASLVQTGVKDISTNLLMNLNRSQWTQDGSSNATMYNHLFLYYPSANKTRLLYNAAYYANNTWNYQNNDLWLDGKIKSADRTRLLMDNGNYYSVGFDPNMYSFTSFTHQLTGVKAVLTGFYRPPVRSGFTWSGSTSKPTYDATAYSHGLWYMNQNNDIYCLYNGVNYPITQGMNIKKFFLINDMKSTEVSHYGKTNGFSLVVLTNDGKLLALSNPASSLYSGFHYGVMQLNKPLTQDKFTSLIKDPRTLATSVVNALSMRKLLNQSSANRISGTFNEFATKLKTDYDYLSYQTQIIKLLDEELTYDTLYFDSEGDPMYASAMAITHDQNALESPIGTDLNNGKTVTNWDRKLVKTGLYTLNPKVKDNPSYDELFSDYRAWNKDNMTLNVLVHRKPIASMRISMMPTAPFVVTARDSMSKDLDHLSHVTRGIIEVEWGIKKLYDDAWEVTKGTLGSNISKTLETGETYIVSYRVKDLEGQWSDPVTEQIVAGMNLLLDAKLKPENPTHSLTKFQTGNNVVFHELWTSYPLAHHLEIQMYDGNTPIFSKVTLRKEWGQVRAENYPERDWQDVTFNIPRTINGAPLADKTYDFVVTAFDSNNPSIKKQNQLQVTTVSNSAPTVSFTQLEPQTFYEGDLVDVKLKVDDPDKDLLNLQVYMRYDNQPEKLLETHRGVLAGTTIGLKRFELPKAKNLQLRAVVTDPLGATGEAKTERPIQALGIEQVALKGAWNHWRGQTNAFGQQMTNDPYRFLGYEKISMTVTTRGEPEQLSLRLEAPLEAMRYVDAKGCTYTYKEEIGAEVQFPIIFRKLDSNKYYLEYILPIADSTISWEGQRKRPPYQLYVTLKKDGRVRTVILGDAPGEVCIDMTGNIFDLVFNQPARPKR